MKITLTHEQASMLRIAVNDAIWCEHETMIKGCDNSYNKRRIRQLQRIYDKLRKP